MKEATGFVLHKTAIMKLSFICNFVAQCYIYMYFSYFLKYFFFFSEHGGVCINTVAEAII